MQLRTDVKSESCMDKVPWVLFCPIKNAPFLASCSFNKHGLIIVIFSKQHQHTFKNYVGDCCRNACIRQPSFHFLACMYLLSPLISSFVSDVFVIHLPMCRWGTVSSRWCCGRASYTRFPAIIPKFGSQPGLGIISFQFCKFLIASLSSLLNTIIYKQWVTSASRYIYCCYLEGSKVSKSEVTWKVEKAHRFWKCAGALCQNYQN